MRECVHMSLYSIDKNTSFAIAVLSLLTILTLAFVGVWSCLLPLICIVFYFEFVYSTLKTLFSCSFRLCPLFATFRDFEPFLALHAICCLGCASLACTVTVWSFVQAVHVFEAILCAALIFVVFKLNHCITSLFVHVAHFPLPTWQIFEVLSFRST